MSPVNAAAKEAHDQELEKMEEDIAKKLEDPNYQPEEEIESGASEGEQPSSAKSAEGENNQPSDEKPEETTPPAKPDGVKPGEDHEELSEEDVQKLSGKAQKRFKSLADENLRVKRENDFLRKHLKPEEKPSETPSKIRLPWETEEEEAEDPVIVAKRAALEAVAEKNRQDTILNNLQSDSTELENSFPELNPKDKGYDPTLVTKISVWYKTLFKDNNNLRLKDFVTELMSLRAAGVDRGKSEVTEKVVKQAAQQAIISNAPASSPASSVEQKIKGAKTMEELEALEAQL